MPAAGWGALRRRGGLTRPGDPGPWGPDNHPRPRSPDYNSGPRGACGSPRPRGRPDRCGPRGGVSHPGLRRTHDHPGPGRPEDHSGAGRPLGRRMGAGSPVRGVPGPRRPDDDSGPGSSHNHSRPRRPDDNAGWRRPHHNRAARGLGRPHRPGSVWAGAARRGPRAAGGGEGAPVRGRRAPRRTPLPLRRRGNLIPGNSCRRAAPGPSPGGSRPRTPPGIPILSSSLHRPSLGSPARRLIWDPGGPPRAGTRPERDPQFAVLLSPGTCNAFP